MNEGFEFLEKIGVVAKDQGVIDVEMNYEETPFVHDYVYCLIGDCWTESKNRRGFAEVLLPAPRCLSGAVQ